MLRYTDPGAPGNGSKSKKKPPTAIILRNDAPEGSETAAAPRDAARRRARFGGLVLFATAQYVGDNARRIRSTSAADVLRP